MITQSPYMKDSCRRYPFEVIRMDTVRIKSFADSVDAFFPDGNELPIGGSHLSADPDFRSRSFLGNAQICARSEER